MRIDFNPFDLDLTEISVSNLETLKSVSEGWYVEYKSQLTSPKNIAKSLAAFANHYGGLLFYGIMESQDGSKFAGSFPGIKKSEVPKSLEDLRNAARNSINPTPYFETRVLEGPCAEIGLSVECSIIMVLIPYGKDAPYIHSDGRVYRRVADCSDPRPETDRFILDNLFQRRKIAREGLRSFLEKRPMASKGEEGKSFLHLYLMTDPLNLSARSVDLGFAKFRELMSDPAPTDLGLSVRFDNIFTMSDGFVARQIGTNEPHGIVLTWHYFFDSSALVTIPLSSAAIMDGVADFLLDYREATNIFEEIKVRRLRSGTLIDINNLFYAVSAIVGQYKKLIHESKIDGPVYTKARFENIWRRIPFFDTSKYVRWIKENGFPLIQFDEELAPPRDTFESLRIIDNRKPDPNEHRIASQLIEAGPLLADIGLAMGLPIDLLFDREAEWIAAANRANEISKKRLEK